MFEKLKLRLAHYIIQRKYCRNIIPPVNYNGKISNGFSFLVLMPASDSSFIHCLDIIKYLQIHRKRVTLVVSEHKYNLIPEKDKYHFIIFKPEQISKLNLPDKMLESNLTAKAYDVVIDLNYDEQVFFSAITAMAKAVIKVGFQKERADKYYGLQFSHSVKEPEQIYRNFLSFIQMF